MEDFGFFHFREEFVDRFMDEGIEVIFGGLAGVHFDCVVIAGVALANATFEGFVYDFEFKDMFSFGLAFDVSHEYK